MNAGQPQTMRVYPGIASGSVTVPASKSHTIRALLIATAAERPSRIRNALDSADARACLGAAEALGAEVSLRSTGAGSLDLAVSPPAAGAFTPDRSEDLAIDVANSGTTLFLTTAMAAVRTGHTGFDGDASIRTRSAQPLLASLEQWGATVERRGLGGAPPYTVRGPLRASASVTVESPTSQYLSALLLTAPLVGAGRTTIEVRSLNEHPYVDLTCWWLDRAHISYERTGYDRFVVDGARGYPSLDISVPGDYSSATFWFVAAALGGGAITVHGLEPDDPQGDKGVLDILAALGCQVEREKDGEGRYAVTVSGRPVRGGQFDLAAMPDAVPALAVLACTCPEPVSLTHVAHARAKETDRLAVMSGELSRLGASIRERPDGLDIAPSTFAGGTVESHGDHRVAMALALAASVAEAAVEIHDSAAAAVTYPSFFDHLRALGVRCEPVDA